MLLHYYLGLDVHKDSIVIAIAEPGRNGELRLFGNITNDLQALGKALNRIRKPHLGAIMQIAYEAAPLRFRYRTPPGRSRPMSLLFRHASDWHLKFQGRP